MICLFLLLYCCSVLGASFPGNFVLPGSQSASDIPSDAVINARYYSVVYAPCCKWTPANSITVVGYHSVMRARRIIASHLGWEKDLKTNPDKYLEIHIYHYNGLTARDLSCDRLEIMYDYRVPNSSVLYWRVLPWPIDLEKMPHD
jgi:hypothetical protein